MSNYYSAVLCLCWLALFVLGVLVHENDRIRRSDKALFYLTYALIAVSSLAEWGGVRLNGMPLPSQWPLKLVKCADYILTPMASGALLGPMRVRSRWHRMLLAVMGANALFQIVSLFGGWMVTIDAQNRYAHGPLYNVYAVAYTLIMALVVIEFILYGMTFRRQNRASLYGIVVIVFAGVLLQECLGGDTRTAYLGLTLGAALVFIHYSEFSQLAADDHLLEQQVQISTDALTHLQSRFAYMKALRDYDDAMPLPSDLAAFSVDVNGLKATNDTLGHEAGDELICGAARCIEAVFGKYGRCYRTGGDEFIVLANMRREDADAALKALAQEAQLWRGKSVKELSIAAGCALAADHPKLTAEELVRVADQSMYEAKTAYYQRTGKERRKY